MTVNNRKNNAAGAGEAVSNRSNNAGGARRAVITGAIVLEGPGKLFTT